MTSKTSEFKRSCSHFTLECFAETPRTIRVSDSNESVKSVVLSGMIDRLIVIWLTACSYISVSGTDTCYHEARIRNRSLNSKRSKDMSKGQDSKKATKKDPVKTPKEKKADKKIKKDEKKR
jgi:hypothetical protein